MKIRKTLYAEEGMVLTDNGMDFTKIANLEIGKDETGFYEITEAEYEDILKKQREASNENSTNT